MHFTIRLVVPLFLLYILEMFNLRMPKNYFGSQGVNFINVFRTNVVFLVTFWLCQKIRTKNSRIYCWWNWGKETSLSPFYQRSSIIHTSMKTKQTGIDKSKTCISITLVGHSIRPKFYRITCTEHFTDLG